MSAIELLPCPFCGGEATTEHDATVEENHAYGCRRCGLWFDTFNSDDAITAWNRRTDLSQAAVAAALETAKDALNKMPRREERLGGQRTQYIQLHEAVETIAAMITDCDRDALAAHVAAEVAKARAEDASEIAQLEQDLDDMRDNAESAYRRGYFEGRNGA